MAGPLEKEIIADLQAAYSINRYRKVEHDSAFGIRQIVDMALRALSPSINDTTTALMCVDYLTAILARLAPRQSPPIKKEASNEHDHDERRYANLLQGVGFGSARRFQPWLPYADNALSPVISANTIGFHYAKHHKGYVDNLNKLARWSRPAMQMDR